MLALETLVKMERFNLFQNYDTLMNWTPKIQPGYEIEMQY